MNKSNKELFAQALNDAVSDQFDKLAESCEEIKLNADSVNYLAMKLNKLVDDAAALYMSEEEIPEELADALGTMWEMCSDYITMYEGNSREGAKNTPESIFWFDGTDTPKNF